MIAFIEGPVQYSEENAVVISISGVGYRIFIPERLLQELSVSTTVRLYTFQYVREDILDLYGFIERADLAFFRKLIQVSGIGPRIALTALSQFSAEQLQRAIIHGDIATLSSIAGIGKKTAERIVIELKDSVGVLVDSQEAAPAMQQVNAVDALRSLGYTPAEAQEALHGIDPALSVEDQLRMALKRFSQPRQQQ